MKIINELTLTKAAICLDSFSETSLHLSRQEYKELNNSNLAELLLDTLETYIDNFDHSDDRINLFIDSKKVLSLFHSSNEMNNKFKTSF